MIRNNLTHSQPSMTHDNTMSNPSVDQPEKAKIETRKKTKGEIDEEEEEEGNEAADRSEPGRFLSGKAPF